MTAEPTLDDLMSDPMTRRLMQRDGVAEDDIRRLAGRLRAAGRLQGSRPAERRSFQDPDDRI